MKLVLLRHGRAQPDAPHGDAKRPLTAGGADDVRSVALQLAEQGVRIDRALVSSSVRTRETCEVFRDAGSEDTTFTDDVVAYSDALYNASVGELLVALENETGGTVLLIGHNPSITGLLIHLLPDGASPTLSMKPAEAAILEVPSLDRGRASVVAYVRPDRDKER